MVGVYFNEIEVVAADLLRGNIERRAVEALNARCGIRQENPLDLARDFDLGMTVNIDDAYIKESIQKPQAKIVMNYTSVQMPQFGLSDLQVDALIAYLKTLK